MKELYLEYTRDAKGIMNIYGVHSVNIYIQTSKNIDKIVVKVEDVNELSGENSRSVEEIASAAEHLNTMTEKLNSTLERFKTA